MFLLLDYHIHSTFSRDSMMTLEDICHRAYKMGIKEIAITEHMDFDPDDYSYGFLNYQAYTEEIERQREIFEGLLIIRKGVEVDYQTRYADEISRWLEGHSFDYVLGSVHHALGVNFSEIEPVRRLFLNYEPKEIYREYFSEVKAAVLSGMFNAIGHMDLVKRQGSVWAGPLLIDDVREELSEVLEAMVRTGVLPEVNTSGWRQPPKEPFPGPDTLKLYRELGGELVTVGSDSHHLKQLGFGLEKATSLLRDLGFRSQASFEQGRLITLDLA